jgi:TatD DNase family protein
MALVDGHIHLPAYSQPMVEILNAKVRNMLLFSVSTGKSDSYVNLKLKEENPDVISLFVGVHPSDASHQLPSKILEEAYNIADGIGEIGLDPKYSGIGEGSQQMLTFLDQLKVAERLIKPIQIHSRNAEKKCLEILESFDLRSVLLHWFEGEDFVNTASAKGYYVSFGPALLYSKRARKIAQSYPLDLILTESDGPVMYRAMGEIGGSSLIASVLFHIAELHMLDFAEMKDVIYENAINFLNGK